MPLSANDFGVEIDETEPFSLGSIIFVVRLGDRLSIVFFFRDTYEIGYDSSGLNYRLLILLIALRLREL